MNEPVYIFKKNIFFHLFFIGGPTCKNPRNFSTNDEPSWKLPMPSSAIPNLRTIASSDRGRTSLRTIFLSLFLLSLSFSSDLFALKIFLFLENENCSASILVRLTDGSMDVNGFVVVEIYRIREIVFTDEQAWPFDNSFFARGNNRSRNQARFISLVAINQSPR